MLESIKQYFQDWSDACEYANECAPDLSFLKIGEPYTALATIAVVCFLVWALNERRIRNRPQASPSQAAPHSHSQIVETGEGDSTTHEKLAA